LTKSRCGLRAMMLRGHWMDIPHSQKISRVTQIERLWFSGDSTGSLCVICFTCKVNWLNWRQCKYARNWFEVFEAIR